MTTSTEALPEPTITVDATSIFLGAHFPEGTTFYTGDQMRVALAKRSATIELLGKTVGEQAKHIVTEAAFRDALRTALAERDAELTKAQDELNCTEVELEAAACNLPDDKFNQGFECMGDFVRAVSECYKAQLAEREAEVEQLRAEQAKHTKPVQIETCKHPKIIGGYQGGSDMAWCAVCGSITWCSDGLIPKEAQGLNEHHAWMKENVVAYACSAECREGGKLCANWCGHQHRCTASIKESKS